MKKHKEDDSHYTGALIEEFNSKITLVLEAVEPLKMLPGIVEDIRTRLRNIESDVTIIKKVLSIHSHQIHDFDAYVAKTNKRT